MATKAVTDSLVNDVIAGKYGNGKDRQQALAAADYDYNAVMAAVNKKLNSTSTPTVTETAQQPAVGNTGGSDVSIGQSSADAQLAEQMRQQQEAYDNLIAYQQEMYNESKKQAAVNRENANRNAYISREIAVKNLPDQLAAQGINGGLSESSMVRLHNNYARTLAQNDLQYNDTVANAYRQMLANKADIESNRPTGGVISGSGAGGNTGGGAVTPSGSSGGYLPVTDDIVQAVIAGKYGNGTERQQRLTAAGYDYREVNAAVTAALSGMTNTPKASSGSRVSLKTTGTTFGMSPAARAFISTNLQTTGSGLRTAVNDAVASGALNEQEMMEVISYYGEDKFV